MFRLFIAKGLRISVELLLIPLLILGDKLLDWEFEAERKIAEKLNQ